jgi:tRNA pseudouridine38-40 synthase
MPRYFLEVSYKGTHYSGFQVQENSNTVQAEVQKGLSTICRKTVVLTGSSRTDAGVHALQNFFHFDHDEPLHPQLAYKLNAILPPDIAVARLIAMPPEAHARFAAVAREYNYRIYSKKDPFLRETAFYFPYKLDRSSLDTAAAIIREQTNFFAFAKSNSQVKTFSCTIQRSEWTEREGILIYEVQANRFLRGMVRLLTATQLKLARGVITKDEFLQLFASSTVKCSFSVPPTGLFLKAVHYPQNFFP